MKGARLKDDDEGSDTTLKSRPGRCFTGWW